MAGGRPTKHTAAIADEICERLAHGESLLKMCKDKHLPTDRTIYRWLDENKEFCQNYARARERQADYYAAEIVELADTCREGVKTRETKDGTFRERGDMVERSRLQIDARKWYASKLAPKKYGDKVALTGGDDGDKPVVFTIAKIGTKE